MSLIFEGLSIYTFLGLTGYSGWALAWASRCIREDLGIQSCFMMLLKNTSSVQSPVLRRNVKYFLSMRIVNQQAAVFFFFFFERKFVRRKFLSCDSKFLSASEQGLGTHTWEYLSGAHCRKWRELEKKYQRRPIRACAVKKIWPCEGLLAPAMRRNWCRQRSYSRRFL